MTEQRFELRKVRDFGELINDTIMFAGLNWKPLLKAYVYICGFFVVASAILAVIQQSRIAAALRSGQIYRNPFSLYGWETVLSYMFVFLLLVAETVMVYSYICLYRDKGNQPPSLEEVWGYFKYFFLRMTVANLLLGLLLILGFILCFFPGVYLWPVFSVMTAVMVFENASLGYSFDRGFKLIRDRWWVTFGALVVMIIAVYLATVIASVPVIVAGGAGMFLGDFSQAGWVMVLGVIIQYLCQVLMILPLITISLAYFSMVELKDGEGLRSRIDSIGSDDPSDLPDEQY